MELHVQNEQELRALGEKLGALLHGGESIELVGDVGAGKTTLTKAVASGMGVADSISSPSYTLSQIYETPGGLRLAHYDFYRLQDAGVVAYELQESTGDQRTVTVIEWADIVQDVLPDDHLTIHIMPTDEQSRRLVLKPGGPESQRLMEQLG